MHRSYYHLTLGFVSAGYQMDDVYKGAFLEKTYESIAKLLEPKPNYTILKNAEYKPADVNFNAIDERSKMPDEQYASLFMYCYDKRHVSTV